MSTLRWIMAYDAPWATYISAVRQRVHVLVVRVGVAATIATPLMSLAVMPSSDGWSPFGATFVVFLIASLALVCVGLAYSRYFGPAAFLEAIGPLFRTEPEDASSTDKRTGRLREAWETVWVPSDLTLKARAADAMPVQARIQRAVRPLRFAILRRCATLQPPNRQAFLAAADKILTEFSEVAVEPDEIKGHPAVAQAVRLVVASDLSGLEPSWATPPSITDHRAWGAWRTPVSVAATLAIVTGLLPIVKGIADLLK